MDDPELMQDADARAARYLASVADRPAFPGAAAVAALAVIDGDLPEGPQDPASVLALLDEAGSPATSTSNGPRYFGFVIGGALPAAMAAERLALAWDQCASSAVNSPAAAAIERAAARLVLEALDLPRESAVGFGTSATACGLACLTAARRSLLARAGWDFDRQGLVGAPELRVVVPETVHITVLKALRVLGFGTDRLVRAACDSDGRVDPAALPEFDERTILCLQAGEVNTGGFDRFAEIIPIAKAKGAWVHVDGAFGLWARASRTHSWLTQGIGQADSWTTDGHKWLNTPYDGAMAVCRDPEALAGAMNADASYSTTEPYAQKNLTLEFSRRARGIPIWAALKALGRSGLAELVDRHVAQAGRLAAGLRAEGLEILNSVCLNQVLVRGRTDEETRSIVARVQAEGDVWFGPTVWRGRPAFRLSVSSWRTTDADIDRAVAAIARARALG